MHVDRWLILLAFAAGEASGCLRSPARLVPVPGNLTEDIELVLAMAGTVREIDRLDSCMCMAPAGSQNTASMFPSLMQRQTTVRSCLDHCRDIPSLRQAAFKGLD